MQQRLRWLRRLRRLRVEGPSCAPMPSERPPASPLTCSSGPSLAAAVTLLATLTAALATELTARLLIGFRGGFECGGSSREAKAVFDASAPHASTAMSSHRVEVVFVSASLPPLPSSLPPGGAAFEELADRPGRRSSSGARR